MSKPLGLQEQRESNVTYLQIKDRSICQYAKTEREGYEEIEVFNPQTKEKLTRYIKRYEGINAFVDEIEFRNEEHKDVTYVSWRLHMSVEDQKYVLEIDFNSAPCTRLMKTAENIRWDKPLYLRAFTDPNRKNATAFMIFQDEKAVPQKYTKDDPGDCPGPESGFGGMNYNKQSQFLYERMVNVVIPACAAAAAARQGVDPGTTEQTAHSEPERQETASETKWTPPSSAKTDTTTASASTQAPSDLAKKINQIRALAAGKGIPNLDAFIKQVLGKDNANIASMDEAETVMTQLKAL